MCKLQWNLLWVHPVKGGSQFKGAMLEYYNHYNNITAFWNIFFVIITPNNLFREISKLFLTVKFDIYFK